MGRLRVLAGKVPNWALRISSGRGCGTGAYGWQEVPGWGYGTSEDRARIFYLASGQGKGDWSAYGFSGSLGEGEGAVLVGCGKMRLSVEQSDRDIWRCSPYPVKVEEKHLREACLDDRVRFRAVFPDGAEWPTDIPRAIKAGLYVRWMVEKLGFLMPVKEEL